MIKYFLLLVFAAGTALAASPDEEAQKSLDGLLKAYSENRTAEAEGMIDAGMLGYQQLIDSIRTTGASQRQIKISLRDIQTTSARDVVVIRAQWEKRYLGPQGTTQHSVGGRTLFLMQLFKKEWKLSSQSGDNIFAK